jgi:hypothetical protein
MRYFVWSSDKPEMPVLSFRKQLAEELIYNNDLPDGYNEEEQHGRKCQWRSTGHDKLTAPKHAKGFAFGKWDCTAADKYQKYTCKTKGCHKLIQTCCSCNPGHWLCNDCWMQHVLDVEKNKDS